MMSGLIVEGFTVQDSNKTAVLREKNLGNSPLINWYIEMHSTGMLADIHLKETGLAQLLVEIIASSL